MQPSLQTPLQITFLNLDRSEAVEAKIRERVDRLARFFKPIISCKVAVDARHRHHQQGNHFQVRIGLVVPDQELIANREPDQHAPYTDIYVALRDAFDAMQRQLEDYVRLRQRLVKTHQTPLHGTVSELHPEKDFGWIETPDARRIYFHRDSLVERDLEQLSVGAEVRLTEELGEDGPQASTVHLVGKHHIVG